MIPTTSDTRDTSPLCPECHDRAVVPGGYWCRPCWRRLTGKRRAIPRRSPLRVRAGEPFCVICGRSKTNHDREPLPSLHTFVSAENEGPTPQYPEPEISDLAPLHRNGSERGFSRTRSKGGRPKLTVEEQRAARARRRARDRERKTRSRAAARAGRKEPT